MKLELVHRDKLSPALFERHPVWAEYYEPEDENRMVEDGFGREEVQRELKRIEYSDSYLIPYVNFSKPSPYEFTLYRARSVVNDKIEVFSNIFVMDNSVNSVSIYVGSESFVINLTDSSFSDEKELCSALGIKAIYPLWVQSDIGIVFDKRFESSM